MKILLPPSETKRLGGRRVPLAVDRWVLPQLAPERNAVIDALVALSDEPEAAARVLKLSERQRDDIVANAQLRSAPTMPAVDRYTGVLYDALAAESLDAGARRWLGRHVWIHSAPFGPVSALDRIPNYRLAANTALPGVAALRRHWSAVTTAALESARVGFVLDLRSESYAALGPLSARIRHVYVRVVTEQGRALNHFNKKAKGELVRALAVSQPQLRSADDLAQWAQAAGVTVRPGAVAHEWELVVPA